eukprot:scaffold22.g6033.t1
MDPAEYKEDSPAILQMGGAEVQQGGAALRALRLPGTPSAAEGGVPAPAPQGPESGGEDGLDMHVDDASWELLTRSQCGSDCGSSPRSLTRDEAAEAAQAVEAATAAAAARQATLLLLPLPPPPPPPPAAAEEAAGAAPPAPASRAASYRSGGDTPRSAASLDDERHDLYSLSQDGSADSLSDTYTDDLMTAAEPDLPPSPTAAVPLASAAPAGGGAGGARDRLGHELAELAERVRAYVAIAKPTATEAAALVWRSVAQWVGSLRTRFSAGLAAYAGTLNIQLAGLREAARPRLAHVRASLVPQLAAGAERAREAAEAAKAAAGSARARVAHLLALAHKRLAQTEWDWVHVALAAGCISVAALLARSWQQNARLATRLVEREELLAELLTRIVRLQSSIRNRTVPLIRHTAASTYVAAYAHHPFAVHAGYPVAVTAV